MKSILALFALLYHPHPPQVLPTKESCSVDLFDTDLNAFYANGMDLRPLQTLEPTLQTLQYIHDRHELFMRLTDFRTSFVVKELLAHEYLDEDVDFAPNVYRGGLLDDWDFDIDALPL
jgi:hypothetical protein